MSRRTLFPGVPFPKEDPKYILPGLSVGLLKRNKDKIGRFMEIDKQIKTTGESPELIAEIVDLTVGLALLAIGRNHAEVTSEELEDLVDMNNFTYVSQAVMGQSGFTLVTELPKEVSESGEA